MNDDNCQRQDGLTVYESACAACHGADLMGVAGTPQHAERRAAASHRRRGTPATKNPVFTVESYWPYATTLFALAERAQCITIVDCNIYNTQVSMAVFAERT